ncbi:DUF3343 domain-containing protein [Geobacter sp. AOG2]|uniref:DUF3343 domain-containing protein n=1 Tax=Geobacter sp. AOG2 TaxID=1566347 RepID=UPI0027E3DEA2|nr:DUF3343 domain-containing protein [Geobacter sp. AOG2]
MEKRLMVQEGHLLAVFNSGHRVMKAESLLKALGLPVLLIPAPRQLQTDCGLALRFNEDVREQVMGALERDGLLPAFVSVYRDGLFVTIWGIGPDGSHSI